MPKDCGCDKKDESGCDKEGGKQTQIWVYKKKCIKNPNIPDNSYVGRIGFTYYLINKDKKESTEYIVQYKLSNLIPGEIVYYVNLYKVVKVKNNKKYIECFSQYSYTKKLEQSRIIDIINKIGNNNYDLTPDDTNEFNNYVINRILKKNKSSKNKTTPNSLTVQITQVDKSYGNTSTCGGACTGVYLVCVGDCTKCKNAFPGLYDGTCKN
jgi:hypothetical protein